MIDRPGFHRVWNVDGGYDWEADRAADLCPSCGKPHECTAFPPGWLVRSWHENEDGSVDWVVREPPREEA